MEIQTVDVPATGLYGTKTRTPKQELGKDDFLLLLTQQLQHQDPLQPMDNTQMISQMASFSTLEQMTNMTKTLEKFLTKDANAYKVEALGLLGMEVQAQRADMGEPIDGAVSSVRFEEGKAIFTVQDMEFELDHLQYAKNPLSDMLYGSKRA